tara:strand:- start:594 stop:1667 length:1074 start_codon:yes stop_codon:yes gene_type:complete
MHQKTLERLIHLPVHPTTIMYDPWVNKTSLTTHINCKENNILPDYTFIKNNPDLKTQGFREHDFAKGTSNFIQRNPKFTLPKRKENKGHLGLEESEINAICKVTDISLPYPEIVLQTAIESTRVDNFQYVLTLLCAECDQVWEHENHDRGSMQIWKPDCTQTFTVIYFIEAKRNNNTVICLDTACYEIQFLTCNTVNPDYPINTDQYGMWRYRITGSIWEINDEADGFGQYQDKDITFHADAIAECVQSLSIALAYPAITRTTKVAGSKPMIKPPMKNLKASSFHKRPVWEHTTLEIDLYNDISEETDATRSSVPKRLHGVRKHLRKCQSGKLTWVKAHTRGNKRLGGLTKDYGIIT